MPLQAEAAELMSVGLDILGRERHLAPPAAAQWIEMTAAAARDEVTLLLVSAFRSLDYQVRIFQQKLAAGRTVDEILKVNAPPGFSEHHSGRAVDVATPGSRPLTEEFETSAAFAWLTANAARFGFAMTYPRDNRFGVVYEPWHWAYSES
jgi:D-alanyl-D-alanine carboxypeptidase